MEGTSHETPKKKILLTDMAHGSPSKKLKLGDMEYGKSEIDECELEELIKDRVERLKQEMKDFMTEKIKNLKSEMKREIEEKFNQLLVLWDIENCAIPREIEAYKVGDNIRAAIQGAGLTYTTIKIQAYADFEERFVKIKEGLQRSGVALINCPSEKEAADKYILVDMLCNMHLRPGSSILLITSDGDDYSYALSRITPYNQVLLASHSTIPNSLSRHCSRIWSWDSLVRGEQTVKEQVLKFRIVTYVRSRAQLNKGTIHDLKRNVINLLKAAPGGFIEVDGLASKYNDEYGVPFAVCFGLNKIYDAHEILSVFDDVVRVEDHDGRQVVRALTTEQESPSDPRAFTQLQSLLGISAKDAVSGTGETSTPVEAMDNN